MSVDVAAEIVNWARWAVAHKPWFNYAEERPFPLYQPTAERPITNDCSATVTLYYWLAGAPDPNGLHYSGFGNTDSLAGRGSEIGSGSETKPADLVIFYDDNGQTVHTALIIEPGADPMTVSHGDQAQPAYVTVSGDGRPFRYFRFDTQKPTPPTPKPTEDDMKAYIARGSAGGVQIVSADCQTKRPDADAKSVTELLATGQFIDLRDKLDPAFVDSIPVSG